jgi:transcriptional regulator with XRE-family HTH domain
MTPEQYRAARKYLGDTQEQLAARLGVTRKTVNSREAGKAPITLESVIAINAILEQEENYSRNGK